MTTEEHSSGTVPAEAGSVRRRRVFYLPGYDPIHPRRYRELYRKEGAAQARISGYGIALEPGGGGAGYGWRVRGDIEGAVTEAAFEVLVWSDIVRASMSSSIPATYGQLVRTAWIYIGSGALWRLVRLRKGPMIAALYPVFFLLGQLALALGAGLLAGLLLARFASWALGLPGMVLVAVFGLRWFRRHDNRVFAWYLMHDFAHAAAGRGAYPPELEARLAEFRTRIREALDEPHDEVLVVGHSSGAHLAVSLLADLLREGLPGHRPALSLLTLGQVVPMISFLPRAQRLRADLCLMSAQREVFWLDVTAPGDGCAFALCDPVAVSGVAPPSEKRWPLVISAAFTQTLSPERWRALRWRWFRLHFQYLCAFDRPGDYDYFRITAGPQTLAQRFRGRAPSKSRIARAASGFTDCTPTEGGKVQSISTR